MSDLSLDGLNTAEPALAERALLACCSARRWADELVVRRPYHDVETLEQVSNAIFAQLTWADIEQGLAAHPRIGERASGDSTEAAWSREEQSAAGQHDQLRDANLAYEQRFGHVFLICATGLSAETILASLNQRLRNDEHAERDVVREELRKIAALRLRKLVGS